MLVSIVIPLYNKQQYVRTAIESVLRQTWQNFEVVVIDDGSKDASADIVATYNDPRIRLIRQENRGVSRTRNRGIEEAHGELICFLDADDWYDKNFLATIVSMAQQYPDNTFYATNFRAVFEHRPEDWDRDDQPGTAFEWVNDFYRRRFLTGGIFHTDSFAAKKADLMALQPCFPPGESLGEDQDLAFRLVDRLKLIYCPKPLTGYRYEVSDGLRTSSTLLTLPAVYSRLEQRARSGQLSRQESRFAFLLSADARINLARTLLINRRRSAAVGELLQAWRGAVKRRWWLTLVMCLFGSATLMEKWDKTRMRNLYSN